MSLLYEKNLKMLPKTNIVLPFNRQYFRDEAQYDSYSTILVLRCKIMQHSTGGKYNTDGKHNFKYW